MMIKSHKQAIGLALIIISVLATLAFWARADANSAPSPAASHNLAQSSQPSPGAVHTVQPGQTTQTEPGAAPSTTTGSPQPAGPASDDARQLSMRELVKLSKRLAHVRCLAAQVREVNHNIFTFYDFETLEKIKGELPARFTVRLLGGQLGNVEVDSPLIPKFTAGAEFVLALGSDNQEGYPTIFPQGIFRIVKDPTTQTQVVAAVPEMPLFQAHDKKPYAAPPRNVPLGDFIFSLRRLISNKTPRPQP